MQAVQRWSRCNQVSPCWKISDAAHAPVGMPIACTAATAASLASAARRAWSRAAPAAAEAANSWPCAVASKLATSSVAADAAERAFDAASAETAARRASSSDACIAASGPRLAKRRRSQVLISSCGGIVGWDPRRDSSCAGRGCSPCAGRVASCAPCAGLVGRGGRCAGRFSKLASKRASRRSVATWEALSLSALSTSVAHRATRRATLAELA